MIRAARWLFRLMVLALIGFAVWLYLPRPAPGPLPPQVLAPLSGPVDRIRIEKAARQLVLLKDGAEVRRYAIALGFAPAGDKERQGDGRTPEGLYKVDRRNDGSAFHLSLGLDYPQPEDRARARAGGYDPGGDIMIHGQPNALPDDAQVPGDWTAGCIALTNAQIREIWAVTPIGTLVEILP